MRVRAMAVLAVLLLTAGCGAAGADGGAGASSAPPAQGCPGGARTTVTEADDGHAVCVDNGGRITVTLPGAGWEPVGSSGSALRKVSAGVFEGAVPGKAELYSARRICPSPSAPGAVACLAMRSWRVTVDVR